MKINTLETHDRLLHFKKQSDVISQGCQDCINNRPEAFESYPFYIFAHKREIDVDERIVIFNDDLRCAFLDANYIRQYNRMDDVPTHRLLWSPRLTKPVPQTNSMLFRYYPENDTIDVLWIIPQEELFSQYEKGLMMGDKIVSESINDYLHNKAKLEKKEPGDLSEEKIEAIYKEISYCANKPTFEML